MWLSALILDNLKLGFPPCVAGKGRGLEARNLCLLALEHYRIIGKLHNWPSSRMRPIAEHAAHVGHEGRRSDCDCNASV